MTWLLATAAAWTFSLPVVAGIDDGEESHVVVKAAKVITAAGDVYAPGIVVITDGKVALVGSGIEYPPESRIVDARGQVVMPGFVLPRTRYHLSGYGRDGVNGDQDAGDEVFLADVDFRDLLEAGYTTVCYVPDGRGITGVSAPVRTGGPEGHRRFATGGFLDAPLDWGNSSHGKGLLRGAFKKAHAEIEKVEKARKEWDEKQKAKAEEEAKKNEQDKGEEKPKPEDKPEDKPKPDKSAEGGDDEKKEGDAGGEKKEGEGEKKEEKFEPPPIDPKYQPIVDMIKEKKDARMMAQVNSASDVLHLIDVLEAEDEPAHSIYFRTWRSTADFHYIVDKLGEREESIVAYPEIYRFPYTTNRYNLFAMLEDAGCKVAAMPRRDFRQAYLDVRPNLAALVRTGLSREAAIKSITAYPAEIIGLGDRIGTIEKDKDADLVFLDGDPLDPHSRVQRVMILGDIVWEDK